MMSAFGRGMISFRKHERWQTAALSRKENPSATVPLIGVVDDDESVRDALSSLIRSAGYRCVVFASAEAFPESDGLRKPAWFSIRMSAIRRLADKAITPHGAVRCRAFPLQK
jgi:hypothetical protein